AEIGRANVKFGWIWILLFTAFGGFLEIRLLDEVWAEQFLAPTRALWRSAHVHGLLLAFYNIFYGIQIDGTNLTERVKRGGSVHAIIGAIVLPISLFLSAFYYPLRYLAALGGLAVIASAVVMAKGQLERRD
ncbi:MAG: hypothetical protein ACE5G7_05145, partial [Candidatus Hydrothermarchaeaceae archaeon]